MGMRGPRPIDTAAAVALLSRSSSVSDVAVACGVTARHLNVAIKSAFGRPPSAFMVRAEAAARTCSSCGKVLPRGRCDRTRCRRCQHRQSATRMRGSRVAEYRIPTPAPEDCAMSRREVAGLLGISETSVEQIEQDGLQKLRDGLLARGIGPETLRDAAGREQGWVFE